MATTFYLAPAVDATLSGTTDVIDGFEVVVVVVSGRSGLADPRSCALLGGGSSAAGM